MIAVRMTTAGVAMKIWIDRKNIVIYRFIINSASSIKKYLLQNINQVVSLKAAVDMATRCWRSPHTPKIQVDISAVCGMDMHSGYESDTQ